MMRTVYSCASFSSVWRPPRDPAPSAATGHEAPTAAARGSVDASAEKRKAGVDEEAPAGAGAERALALKRRRQLGEGGAGAAKAARGT